MRISTEHTLAVQTTALRFSKSEQAALLRASEIAKEARRLAREAVGPEFEHDGLDTWLAEIEHNVTEVIEGIILDEKVGLFL